MLHLINRIVLLMAIILPSTVAYSDTITDSSTTDSSKLLCPDAQFWGKAMLTDVCWSCMFPIRLFGATIHDGDNFVPDGATEKTFCSCDGNSVIPAFGVTAGAWLPARLVEVVRKPYCSPIMGGMSFNNSVRLWGGSKQTETDDSDKTFFNYHYWAFPLYAILELFTQTNCNAGGLRNLDMMYMSELDPTWNVDELAFFMNPEAVIFANPLAVAACTVDCAKTTATGKPMTSLWWCAGCWGNLYPFSGNIASDGSAPRDTSLLTARLLSSMHRKSLAHKTYGDNALCGGTIYPMLPKQQYKLSTLFPIAEADGRCCHAIGESTFRWGENRSIPGVGEDYVYMVWRYADCCLTGGD